MRFLGKTTLKNLRLRESKSEGGGGGGGCELTVPFHSRKRTQKLCV